MMPRAAIIVAWVLVCAVPGAVGAQAPGQSGLPPGPSTVGSSATLSMSFDQSADDNSQFDQTSSIDNDPQFRGLRFYSGTRAQLAFSKRERRYGWQLSGGSSVRFYPGLQHPVNARENVAGSGTFPLSSRIRVQGSGSIVYAPLYSLAAPFSSVGPSADAATNDGQGSFTGGTIAGSSLGGGAAPAGGGAVPSGAIAPIDYSVVRRAAYSSGTNVGMTYSLGPRSSLSLTGGQRRTDFVQHTDPSLKSWNALAGYQYRLSKNSGIRAGYGRQEAEYGVIVGPNRAQIEMLDLGIDYRHPLSFSRNTTVGFSSGMTSTTEADGRRYGVAAHGNVDQIIGRAGHLGLQYDRGVQLVEGLVHPLFVDTGAVSFDGALSRKLTLTTQAAYSTGEVGTSTLSTNGYRAYTGSVRLGFPLTSHGAFHVDYFWYRHQVGSGVQLLGQIPNEQRRQSIRAGLALWLPLRWIR